MGSEIVSYLHICVCLSWNPQSLVLSPSSTSVSLARVVQPMCLMGEVRQKVLLGKLFPHTIFGVEGGGKLLSGQVWPCARLLPGAFSHMRLLGAGRLGTDWAPRICVISWERMSKVTHFAKWAVLGNNRFNLHATSCHYCIDFALSERVLQAVRHENHILTSMEQKLEFSNEKMVSTT